MDQGLPVGTRWLVDGEWFERTPGRMCFPTKSPTYNTHNRHHFTSKSLPRWHPDAPRHNEMGQPMFDGKREVDEFCARASDREDTTYSYGELDDE